MSRRGLLPLAPAASCHCPADGPCCAKLVSPERWQERSSANQLVEIMIFTSTQLSFGGGIFYSFTCWLWFYLLAVLFCFVFLSLNL